MEGYRVSIKGAHWSPGGQLLVAGILDIRLTHKRVILRVKMGKNFAKNRSKAHIPNDKNGEK
jgi:hypothetical protein